MRLALKLFRGEPAISGFDWNFSPIHSSSPPFSTTSALFRLAFASASNLQFLTSLHNATRRSVLQKVRNRTSIVLLLLVNTGFQVLFHSPPGVLFTFPSRYYALSVTISAWKVVLPASHRISRVLRYSGAGSRSDNFVYGAVTLSGCIFQSSSTIVSPAICRSATPESMLSGLASFPFARRYSGNHYLFSLPPGT